MHNIFCFGDSNTWGYNPETRERFSNKVRWTAILKDRFYDDGIEVVEDGVVGRTTIFEDRVRPGKNGLKALKSSSHKLQDADFVVLMLGTNDCKKYYRNSPRDIADGIADCLDIILEYVEPENVLLVSPIHLGEKVWQPGFDPEFDRESVIVSYGLEIEYKQLAREYGINFIAASDYVSPSKADQEHMDAKSHAIFADIIYNKIREISLVGV